MIVLTPSDVRVYSLGLAQLIPVLLIALFVADSGRQPRLTDKLLKESSDLESESQKLFEKVKRRSEKRIAKLETEIAEVDAIDPSQISEEVLSALGTSRAELAARLEDESAKLSGISKSRGETIAQGSVLRKAVDAELPRLRKGFAFYLVFGIFVGLVGEIIALWGAIGLISGLYAVAFGTLLTVFVLGVLTHFALDRFTVEFISSNWFANIQVLLDVGVLLVAAGSGLWIVNAVKVVHL